ncbi:MAG: hydroxyacid dehydrogenase [Clostridiales bacterium]|nr:hydroxyacid dehydrogenase [Clostridiales bacterium]
MNLLITGAAKFNNEQISELENLGYAISYQPDESAAPETDFASADAVVCNGLFLHHDIDAFENLKFIQLTSAGLDRVPLDRINERKIKLCNARGVYSVPMAEFAVGGILNIYKGFNGFYDNQKKHIWDKNRKVRELEGSVAAIVGCGSIGNECAKRLRTFSVKLIGVDIVKPQADLYDEFVEVENIKKAFSEADIVILTLPLTDETRDMVNLDLLSCCKKDVLIVNLARGALINETDLITVLKNGLAGGAFLDVFEEEPLREDSPLWDMDNVIVTPHNSFVSDKNSDRFFKLAYENLKAFAKGETV